MPRASTAPLPLIVLAFAFVLAISLQAQEEEALLSPPEPALHSALGDLVVNGGRKDNIEFYLDENGQPYIRSAMLRDAVEGLARPEKVADLIIGDGLISAGELEPRGLSLAFNEAELKLVLTVSPRAMIPQDLTARKAARKKTGEVRLEPEKFSSSIGLALNLDPRLSLDDSMASFSVDGGLKLTPSIYLFGLVAEAKAEIDYSEAFSFTLDEADLLYDFPSIRSRLRAGIVDSRPVNFQTSSELAGFSFYSDTSAFASQKRHLTQVEDLVLERKAQVTVEMNGLTIRKQKLEPGSYQLSDLPLSTGLNDVVLKIEEEGEEPVLIHVGIPFDSGILAPGETDFSLVCGLDRESLSRPFAEGSLSLGLTKSLEMGLDAEAGYGSLLGGLSSLWASPLGNLGLAAACASPYEGEGAFIPDWSWQASWRLSLAGKRKVPRLGLAVKYRGPEFAPPQKNGTEDPALHEKSWELSGQISQDLLKGAASLGLYGEANLRAGELESASLSAALSIPVRSSMSLAFSVGGDWSSQEGLEAKADFSLSVVPSDRRILQYSHDFITRNDEVDIAMTSDSPLPSSLSFHAEGLVGDTVDRGLALSWQERGRYFNLTASGSYSRSAETGERILGGGFTANTTMAFAGGYSVAASSMGNALAILVPAPSLGTEEVELLPQNGAATSSLGGKPSLVSGIRPYSNYFASVEMPSSPPDMTPTPKSIELYSTYKSITIIDVRAAAAIAIHGRLVDEEGRILANLPGDLLDPKGNKKAFAGTFSDEEGIFECYDLDSGEHTILWSDGRKTVFTIAKDEERTMIDMGDMLAKKPVLGEGSSQ